MKLLLTIAKVLTAIFAGLVLIFWIMIHGTSHIIPTSTEWGYAVILMVLALIYALIELILKKLKTRPPQDT
jgi:hypothetical protein